MLFKIMFLLLSGFSLKAMQNNPNFIDIKGLDKQKVLESLYDYAQKKAPAHRILNWDITRIELNEYDIEWVKSNNWDIEQLNSCDLYVDLSKDMVNVRVFNTLYGPNAAQKAIALLKQKS